MTDRTPRRVLLVRLSHLGDVVLALPVFHAVRAAFPEAEVGWVVQPEFADLLRGIPGLARIFHFERRGGLGAWTALRAELMRWAPDLAVDAQGNWKSAVVALASGAPRRLGLARRDWAEAWAAGAMTEHAEPAAGRHGMLRSLALAAHLAPASATRRDPALSAEEIARGREDLAQRLPTAERGWILHIARERDVRSWPLASYEALARILAHAGRPVLFLSGPREADLGRALEARASEQGWDAERVFHWSGQRGLRSLAGFFAAAAAAGHGLVSCDSGPAHVAAAVDLPVALLAGPQEPARTGPWPPPELFAASPHLSLKHARPPHCQPCLSRECRHRRGPVCMSGLDPERVAAALL